MDYKKKQKLIQIYFEKIKELELERKSINAQLKSCNEKFEELINCEADPSQLQMFENMDQFLIG